MNQLLADALAGPLPFEPEPLEQLRARFGAALMHGFCQKHMLERNLPTPGRFRRHVFQFDDGLHLIVSMDRNEPDDEPLLHVSASVFAERADGLEFKDWLSFREFVLDHFDEIDSAGAGKHREIVHELMTPGGIPHFFFKP